MKKRILSILLTLCMVLMLCPVTAFADVPPDTIVGDINLDGAVTIRDAILLQNYLEGLESFTNEQLVVADFNGDGVVNYSDLTELQRSLELPESGITVTNGKATACGTEISEAAEGTRVTLTADSPPDGMDPSDAMVFDKWIVESGSNVTLADANSATTTFTMPAGPVSVTATYKPLSAGETGGLAITVNGFEVGKTPADCTYSFESTNLGVTFSEGDVALVAWSKYVEEIGEWESIYDDEWFEAGTRYQLCLELNDKGLSELPAVTINGKTPEFCGFVEPRKIVMDCEFGTPVAPALAVTVDGFEVGKTPADCTYSFASTNMDVDFSADDIQSVRWEEYLFYASHWSTIWETEVFEADTVYRLRVYLDNKGLSTAPAVTVNGKTPEFYAIATSNGVPIQLQICCTLDTPAMPPLTIDGPDVVCAQQDYEFTVTPLAGVTLAEDFGYDTGSSDSVWNLTIDENGVGHGVVPAEGYDPQTNRFTLTAEGTTAGGTLVTGSKTVEISPKHLYVDGVCGCGAVQTYTVEYIGGGDDPICADFKTHGEALTLRGETFTMDGFVQTGWVDGQGAKYDLGAAYTEDRDVTLYPVFDQIVTLTVPYTTTVALGDAGEPGETTFELALIDGSGAALTADNVTAAAAVTTDGAGDYTGALTITGPEWTLWHLLSEGAFVQQVDAGEAGWTYDDTVWGVLMEEIPVAYAMGDDATASGYTVYVVPASIDGNGYYYIDWENLQAADMAFTNTYTAHDYALKHDATHHWDECACKDVQNKELHKYGDWKVTKEATQTEAGEKEHTCTVCGYTEKETIPVLGHTHDYALKHDATSHWDECDCGDIQNKEAHKYGDWKVTKEATEQEAGEKEHTCTVCGYTEKETIPALGHTHDYAQKYDATSHWDECDCGDIQNKEAHKYGDWKVTKEATATKAGEKEHTCTVCGYTEKAEIAKLAAKPGTTAPATGDNSHMALWFALLCVSGAGVIGTTVYGRKKRAK